MSPLDSVVERYIAATAASDSNDVSSAGGRRALEAAAAELNAAVDVTRRIQTRLDEEVSRRSKLEADIVSLTALRQTLENIEALEVKQADAVRDHERVLENIAELKDKVVKVENTLAADRQRRESMTALAVSAATANDIALQGAELDQLVEDLKAKISVSLDADAAAKEPRASAPALRAEEQRVQAEIDRGTRDLEEARKRASILAAAVAAIASHLEDHDQSCPVCATTFEPGVLKKLADSAAVAQDAALAPLEVGQAALVARLAQINRDLGYLVQLVEAADRASEEVVNTQRHAETARTALAARLGVDVTTDLVTLAARRDREAAAAVAELTKQIDAGSPSVASAQETQTAAVSEIVRLNQRLAEIEQTRTSIGADMRRHREALVASGRSELTIQALSAELAERNELLADVRAKEAEVRAELAAAVSAEAAARQRVTSAQSELAQAEAAAGAAKRDMAALQAHWTQTGLTGAPEASTLEVKRAELSRFVSGLALLLDEQGTVAVASEAAARHQDLAELIQRMENQAGKGAADKPQIYERQLKRQYDEALAAHALTETARAAVYAYSEHLKKEAENFSTQFLMPLNNLIDDYNRALLSTPGESIRFIAEHNVDRTKFDMGLRYRDLIEDALYNTDLPPQIVLSEGQMAANGFSILCAASTAYPWSTWRALLLDDPLQHNDIIHAAAFVDLMRNLVELQRYQLVMSSHDRAEGEFFARKFDAAGLPCTVVALTAPSKDGVRFEPPHYNAAARSLLRKQVA